MDINKEIIMTIVNNSKGRLEYDQEFFEINEEQLALISKKLTKLFSLHGVGNCLPKKEDVASELENHLDKWGKSHSKQTNDTYALGFRHCFHYMSDWIKHHR
jgi:hypothetical protein